MKRYRIFQISPVVVLITLLSIFYVSCKKEKNVLAANVQDQEDVLQGVLSDTASIFAHSLGVDSIASFNDAIKFIGSNQDPVFGRTDVGLYTKFSLPNNITDVSFGEDAELISAEIILPVRSLDFVGDALTPLQYDVYEVNQELTSNKIYFSNQNKNHNPTNLLGTFTGTFGVVDGQLALRIPLNATFARGVLTNPQFLTNNTVFQSTYKGFYITSQKSNLNPVSAQGAITKVDLDSQKGGFFLYYRNGGPSTTKQTKTFRFPFNGNNVVRYNTVNYKYTDGADQALVKQLQGDTLVGKQALFLKGIGGTRLKIHIPFLTNYVKQNKIAVNRAEVIVRVDQSKNGSDLKYNVPPVLALLAIDSLGREIFTYDQLSSLDFARYGGYYDSDNKHYVFNISRDIQMIMNGKRKNLGFYLVVANPDKLYTARRDDRAERVVLGGTNNTLYKPSFRLTFTPFTND
jgi:hypothetical protein